MIPILYESNEQKFNTLGLGALKDCIKPTVTEERNGLFYFEMKYPVNGVNYEAIEVEKIIVADASHSLRNQRFVITRITKPINGVIEVYAEHISLYITSNDVLVKDINVNGSALDGLKSWKSNTVYGDKFTVDSNISTKSRFKIEVSKAKSSREVLGGVRGSILDTYGGEFKFDNLHIRLLKSRGLDRGVRVDYGNNLLDFEQDMDITDTYTSICPYVILTSSENNEYKEEILMLPEKVVHGNNAKNFSTPKIKYVEFDSKKANSVESLRKLAVSYLKSNRAGFPKNKIDLSFIELSHTLNFEGLEKVKDEIDLGDTLTLNFPRNKLFDVKMKVTLIKWDVLREEIIKVVVGSISSRFQNNVVKTLDLESLINDEIPNIKKDINTVRVSANGNTLVFEGEDEPNANNVGDRWIKYLPNGDKELYYWDGAIWQPLITEKMFIELRQDLEKSKKLIEEAEAKAEAHKESIDLEIKEIDEKIKKIDGVKKEDLDEIKQKLSDTSETTEMVAELVGGDGRTTYNKNRATVTEGIIKLGEDKYLEITHNGDGFEVGKEYTISFEAECEEYAFYKVAYNFDVAKMFPTKVVMTPNNKFLPVGQKEFKDKKGTIHGGYKDTYTIKAENDWYKLKPMIKEINSDEEILINFEFKEMADGNVKHNYEGVWSDKPELILDGGGE